MTSLVVKLAHFGLDWQSLTTIRSDLPKAALRDRYFSNQFLTKMYRNRSS